MFTGIIETVGTVTSIQANGTNLTYEISSPLSSTFTVDQSISHNGVCLTVETVGDEKHTVTAIDGATNRPEFDIHCGSTGSDKSTEEPHNQCYTDASR